MTMNQPPEQLGQYITTLMPTLKQLASVLRQAGIQELEMNIEGAGGRLLWLDNGAFAKGSPNQQQITFEVTKLLDDAFPNKLGGFMGMLYSHNALLAEKIAKVVAEYRRKDRADVASQVQAILAAFQQGS
jgi:hypothetical protein